MRGRRREEGFTLAEIVISLTVFGVLLFMMSLMTREMVGNDKRYPVNFLAHPQVSTLLSRLRRDVLDATMPYYVESIDEYAQSSTTLILYSLQDDGSAKTIVWDFSKPGEVHRIAFSVGIVSSRWVARGVPQFEVSDFPVAGHPDSVRVMAKDKHGRLAVDQILQPRPHE